MSLFGKIFGSGRRDSRKEPGSLEQQLRDLETKAEKAPLGAGWTYLNRAGDTCIRAGDKVKGVQFFGRAIDVLLGDEQPEPARGVAKKIIRVHPQAVRTLCTLTWLDLAARQPAAAVLSLGEYAKVAIRRGKQELAADEVYTMARLTRDEAFLQEAVEVLKELDAPTYAAQAEKWLRAGGSEDSRGEPEALARFCLSAAVGSNALKQAEGALA